MTPKRVTLKTLNQSSAQEVFDWVVYNLIKQGRRSQKGNKCRYRTVLKDGTVLKCAGGWLMTYRDYRKFMDSDRSTDWFDLVTDGLLPSSTHSFLICNMQIIHDAFPAREWKNRFKKLAKEHELEYKY